MAVFTRAARRKRRRAHAPKRGIVGRLPAAVFVVVLLLYTFANAPFETESQKADSLFQCVEAVAQSVIDAAGSSGKSGAESDAESDVQEAASADVTLEALAESSKVNIKVLRKSAGTVEEVPLEEYTACVVASEMPSDFQTEALKAQAVAARTYALSRMNEFADGECSHYDDGAYVCDSTHCQVYRDEAALREVKGDEWMQTSFPKILQAVSATEGEAIYYDGELVTQPLFFSSSGGRTENSEDVFVSAISYLRSVESGAYEEESPYNSVQTSFTMDELKSKVEAAYGKELADSVTAGTISVISRTDGGAVARMQLGAQELTGRQVRSLCGLASADFDVSVDEETDSVTFVTSGSGHCVGLSQYGANGMAKQGKTYSQILKHYYSGVEIREFAEA